jgi:2'-5' RNA ligase
LRTFIAIDLDPELKKVVETLVIKLKKTGADVRWVGFPGMHLTLKFLGEVAEESLPAIGRVMKEAARAHAKFPLVLQGTGSFPGGQNPRVLWVGIREEPGLMSLERELEDGLEAEGYPRETRPFHPHLTLGRVGGRTRVQAALLELDRDRETVFGQMTARKVTLFESLLRPQGAEYRALSEFELS